MANTEHLLMITVLALCVATVSTEQWARKCAQCVSGNFLLSREMFQSPDGENVMGWMQDWMGTDCVAEKKVRLLPCKNACITVLIEKKVLNQERYIYDGLMMDCADELIYKSQDIPPYIDPLQIKNNYVFVASRGRYNISYYFTTKSTVAADIFDLVPHHNVYTLSPATSKTTKFLTFLLYLIPFTAIVLACYFVINENRKRRNAKKAQAAKREQELKEQVEEALREINRMTRSEDVEAQIEETPITNSHK